MGGGKAAVRTPALVEPLVAPISGGGGPHPLPHGKKALGGGGGADGYNLRPSSPTSPKENTPLVAAAAAVAGAGGGLGGASPGRPPLPRKGSLKSGRLRAAADGAPVERSPRPALRVQWPDNHGEALTQVREFEPSASDDSDEDDSDSETSHVCSCVIQ